MAEYPMNSPPVAGKRLDEAKVEDVNEEQPPPYQSLNSNIINLIPTRSEPSQRQPEDSVYLTTTNVNLDSIKDHQCWSVFNILCCWCVLGCVACYFSHETNKLIQQGDRQGALRASRYARNFNRIATIVGVLFIILYIIKIMYFPRNTINYFP
jgi:hypothetical protein